MEARAVAHRPTRGEWPYEPKLDGSRCLAFRDLECRGRAEALALTAFARAEDRKRTLAAAYQAHLAKPFDVGELILRVRYPRVTI